jgi:4-oxalocrotonate tautomerase
MPLVNVRLIEGVFTPEQKREMIHQLTETMVEIEGEKPASGHVGDRRGGQEWGLGHRRKRPHHRRCPRSAGPGPGRGPGLRFTRGDTAGTVARVSSDRGRRAATTRRICGERVTAVRLQE